MFMLDRPKPDIMLILTNLKNMRNLPMFVVFKSGVPHIFKHHFPYFLILNEKDLMFYTSLIFMFPKKLSSAVKNKI